MAAMAAIEAMLGYIIQVFFADEDGEFSQWGVQLVAIQLQLGTTTPNKFGLVLFPTLANHSDMLI
jgi:hypothetical protein